ncbi:MAG TPA: MBL fold metallo-hydrolase [Actinomycetes bacterium]|nr:MBL fold metallo-hydrolase [Actinomycetes bacterium]
MLVAGFPSAVYGTNVYVVAPAPGEECVIVDPGMEVSAGVDELLREHRLKPVAVLLTHGHIDHIFSVVPVAGSRGISAYIHPDDREMLADPMKGLSTESTDLFGGRLQWQEPDDVSLLADGVTLSMVGLEIAVAHAPGHTPGSVMFRVPGSPDGVRGLPSPPRETLLSGDVLFAGSIGRTDLPGGSHSQMLQSLRDKVLPLDDDILVLPGHGGATTIGRERESNPFLRGLLDDQAADSSSAAGRGL